MKEPLRKAKPDLQMHEPQPGLNTPLHAYDFPAPILQLLEISRTSSNHTLLDKKQAAKKASMGLSTMLRDIKEGTFPKLVQISPRRVAIVERELDAFLAAKILISRSNLNIDIKKFISLLTAP